LQASDGGTPALLQPASTLMHLVRFALVARPAAKRVSAAIPNLRQKEGSRAGSLFRRRDPEDGPVWGDQFFFVLRGGFRGLPMSAATRFPKLHQDALRVAFPAQGVTVV